MTPSEPDRKVDPATHAVEASSPRLLVGFVLTAFGCYAVLATVLILGATNASAQGLLWLVVPGALFGASAAAVFVSSWTRAGERLRAMSAIFDDGPSRDLPGGQTAPPARGRM